MMRRRLIIVEDHPLVAQGLRALLEPNYDVAEIVNDARHALTAMEWKQPSLVLLDLSMPQINGLELLPQLKRAYPSVKVLVVTMHLDRTLAELSFRAGADGFVPKEATALELHEAVAAVLRGERYLSPRVPKHMERAAEVLGKPAFDRLTPRQLQILKLVGEGKQAPEIAVALGLSHRTVEFHRTGIRRALGIVSEWGLVRFAITAGLVGGGAGVPVESRLAEDAPPAPAEDA